MGQRDGQVGAGAGDETLSDGVHDVPSGSVVRLAADGELRVERPAAVSPGVAYNRWLRGWNERMRFAQQACGGAE